MMQVPAVWAMVKSHNWRAVLCSLNRWPGVRPSLGHAIASHISQPNLEKVEVVVVAVTVVPISDLGPLII